MAAGASPPTAAAAVAAAVAAGGATSVAPPVQPPGDAGNLATQQVPGAVPSPQPSDAAAPLPSPPLIAARGGRESPVTEKEAAQPGKDVKSRVTKKLTSMFRTAAKKKTDEAGDSKLGVNGNAGSDRSAVSAANESTLSLLRSISAGGDTDAALDAVSAAGTDSEKLDNEQKAVNTLRKGINLFKRKKNPGEVLAAENVESDARSASPPVAVTADLAAVHAAGNGWFADVL